jgi:L-malate glycosyltransferase
MVMTIDHESSAEKGPRVLVITPCAPSLVPTQGYLMVERFRGAGAQVTVIGKAKSGLGRFLEIVLLSLIKIPWHDVVLINMFAGRAFLYEALTVLYASIWRKRIVVVLRSGFMEDFVKRWPRLTKRVLSQPTLVLVPHRFLEEKMCLLGQRIDGVIPNFVELENYKYRERSVLIPRFLYLRGMHPFYNAPMAIRAFSIIQSKYPNASLTMAGKEGEDLSICRQLVSRLQLRNVQFVGLVPKDAIPGLADTHDVHLHTNRVENMPVSIIEMWASGLPIVATKVGGIPYLIRDREDGILVQSENFQAMADACLELLSDAELARRLSRNGRARAAELTWERVKPNWEKALMLDCVASQKTANNSNA